MGIGASIGIAGLTGWSREGSEFLGIAFDGETVGDQRQQAFEEVFEGGEPVHPAAPEVREGLVGDHDTAERHDEEEEHGYEQRSEEFVGGEPEKGVSNACIGRKVGEETYEAIA